MRGLRPKFDGRGAFWWPVLAVGPFRRLSFGFWGQRARLMSSGASAEVGAASFWWLELKEEESSDGRNGCLTLVGRI